MADSEQKVSSEHGQEEEQARNAAQGDSGENMDGTMPQPDASGSPSQTDDPVEHPANRSEPGDVISNEEGEQVLETPAPALLPSPMAVQLPPAATLEEIIASRGPDSPTASLITSLRSQLALLSDQSTDLNTKLIEAIGRHADLEDTHLALQQKHVELEGTAKDLAAEKAKWEESMNTGLLVERAQIKDEMQKLAAGLVEEERKRGSAEERRMKVEDEVDELTTSLFDQANTMVAVERMARTTAETRLKETEDNLAAAESAMRAMQLHLQSLPAPATSPPSGTVQQQRRYLASHLPYGEFLQFISHLRSLRPLKETSKAIFPPPNINTLVAQAFIARAITEDHDPTIRLDSAPTLSYFSRRNVGPAIIAGELIIEPVSASTVIAAATSPAHDINCSLCGKPVFPSAVPQSPSASHFGPPPLHPTQQKQSRFSLKPFFNATASPSGTNASPSQSPLASPVPAGISATSFAPVYIFKVNRPAATASSTSEKDAKLYPLCHTGWCLERLRAACELWHFVRTGIIQVVWMGDDGYLLPSELRGHGAPTPTADNTRRVSGASVTASTSDLPTDGERPPMPERKKSSGWGSLGFKLGSNEPKPSNTGGSWFGKSGSATPPKTTIGLEQGLLQKEETGLGAPIDLQTPTGGDNNTSKITAVAEETSEDSKGDVPRIERQDASPVASLTAIVPANGQSEGVEESDNLKPALSRTGSANSIATSNGGTEEGMFSTPKGQANDLPEESVPEANEEAPEAKESAEEKKDETPRAVDLAESATPIPTPAPPPIPRRSANRMSKPATPITSTSPSFPESISIPTEPTPVAAEAKEPVFEPVDITNTGVPTHIESGETTETTESTRKAPPPPLPPRHPQTPANPSVPDHIIEGEKRWMKADSEAWEEKTWRTVLRLKEGMWKARVGVSDEAD